MPLHYARDDHERRVVLTMSGPFQVADVVAILERQREDGTWNFGLLIDTSRMSGRPSIDDLREFIRLSGEPDTAQRRRGPLAIVAIDADIYATSCAYAALAPADRTVQVFRERVEAEQWLSTQTIR